MRLIEVHKDYPNVPAMSEEEYDRYLHTRWSKRRITEFWLHYMENIRKIEDLADKLYTDSYLAEEGKTGEELDLLHEKTSLDHEYLESWWRPFMEQLFNHFHTHGYYGLSKKHKGWAKQFVRARSEYTILGIQNGIRQKFKPGRRGRVAYNYTDDPFGRRYKEREQTTWKGKKDKLDPYTPRGVVEELDLHLGI